MKNLIAILFMTFFVQGFHAQGMKGMQMPKEKTAVTAQVTYTCPMHPEIHASKPGNCPKCGMKLVKEKAKPAPKTVKSKPKENAMPKAVVKEEKMDDAATHDNQQAVTYTCPMHPEIHTEKPGNCPKCGMKLEKEVPKSMDDMEMGKNDKGAMDMGDDSELSRNIKKSKANLGTIRTIRASGPPRTVRYDLHIKDTLVTFGNKTKRAIAVNGQIPMPTLTFTEGDTAEIHVYNELDEETTLHWHGLFLPNKMDGVPFLTQMPIKPHSEYLYKFPIIQHGTHWYHSHSGLQEQIGMYGAFIMNKREEWNIPTIPVVISEWTDMNPKNVHRMLHNASDWFAIKKGTTQSYAEAIRTGHFKTKITNEWKRMNAMDVSDVYYENFLLNGKNQNEQPQFKAGDKVRLRIANGGASDYFWLTYSGGKITVVATDGNDVEPVEVDRLIIAVSETYDVVVTIPENKSYEFLVTPEDRTKSASMWLGSGEKVPATKLPKLKYFAGMKMMNEMMDMQGNMVEMEGMKMQNQEMDMNTVMYPEITGPENPADESKMGKAEIKDKAMQDMPMGKDMQMSNHQQSMAGMDSESTDLVTLNYAMLKSPEKTTLPEGPWKELKFDLTGNMNRYVWSLDNKVVSESDKILIKKGENLRIILYNNSMMRHPMHLHGHDFRVINGQGDYAPLKNIIDIMPMERDTIEFTASEPGGDWFFHCHILYHMMSGMGRVFSYENSAANPEIPNPKLAQRKLFADDRSFHLMAENDFASNGNDGMAMIANTRWQLMSEWRLGYNDMHGYESETHLGYYVDRMQWLMPFIGFDWRYRKMGLDEQEKNLFGQENTKDIRSAFTVGVEYTLPMLFKLSTEFYTDGTVRLQLKREDIPISKRLRMTIMGDTDKEYMAGFKYIITKNFAPSIHYDSDMGLGGGFTLTY
ncbi:multicopper oxidase domain-containing protein [Flavobacterium sp.]|uniref:multicopper oxidase domain-containing protein n=1 Tax=Flavobacterium sp. TaxID=239 RepID=UPI0026189D62|nr:multicopper oxidase domain-containing protein [Flavobacterium sp.]